jgi:hypothetical protein
MEELIRTHIQPRIPFVGMEQVMARLESLLKERQVMSANGVMVYQECKGVAADVQGAFSNLQRGASNNLVKKRGQTIARGKL